MNLNPDITKQTSATANFIFKILIALVLSFIITSIILSIKNSYTKEAVSCGQLSDGNICETYRCDTGYARTQPKPGGGAVTCSDLSAPRLIKKTVESYY